ncbi:hypothetical protein [Paracoccus pacificus]|uniref:Lipoprotein n=1 Tax=Paracoccus pacificus TaxID=1463598 RepID=A0ABW4R497_9RHOB
MRSGVVSPQRLFRSFENFLSHPLLVRRARGMAVCLTAIGLASCTSPGIEATRAGREMRRSQSETSAGILKDAVFFVVKDMTASEAASTLSSDGAICDNRVCYWTFTERETLWNPMRPPDLPLRTWVLRYQVEFTSNVIDSKDNIVSTVASIETNSGITLSETR